MGKITKKYIAEVLPSLNDQWYWRFVATNGKVLCHSETYTRRRDAVRALNDFIVKLQGEPGGLYR